MLKISFTIALVLIPVIGTTLWRLTGRLLRSYFIGRYTVLKELSNVGKARKDGDRIKGTAVICGGSIAGLWAARVCSDHFEDVVILEPETWLATEDGYAPVYDEKGEKVESTRQNARTRIGHYFGAHTFQILLIKALHHVFPTFDDEMRKRDGRVQEPDYNVHTSSGHFFRVNEATGGNVDAFYCSRDTFERLLRFLVMKSSTRIRYVAGTATGVRTAVGDSSRITAVNVNLADGGNTDIPAALVIDCTGATQAGLKWAKKLHTATFGSEGMPDKVTTAWDDIVVSYNIHQRWKTYIFTLALHLRERLPIPGGYDKAAWLYSFVGLPGVERKCFLVDRIDGHRMRYSFYGWGDPPIPDTAEDIREYLFTPLNAAKQVPDWIKTMTEIILESKCDVFTAGSKLPPLNWVKYERAPFLPSNFCAIGDAVMRVNPTFGQGCTKSCIGAIALDSVLRSPDVIHKRDIPYDFSRRFFKVHRDKMIDAWEGTKPMDYMYETTTPIKGEELSAEKVNGSLTLLLLDMAVTDHEIDAILVNVRHFLAPATDLLAPWVLWRIISFAFKRKIGLV